MWSVRADRFLFSVCFEQNPVPWDRGEKVNGIRKF